MIPLLDLSRIHAPILPDLEDAARRVIHHGKFIMGPEVAQLERELEKYCEAKHVVSCASGSDALLLALQALDLNAGDEVITTPYTFFSTVSSITRLGLVPVFVDINPATFNIDVSQIEAAITPRTKAVIPVHLFGQMVQMDELVEFCQAHGLRIIEDAAQALGSRWKGRMAGTWGDVGTYSFFPSKNLGCCGDGGAIVTNDDALAERLRILRLHGAKPKYFHRFIGINSRIDTLQAALLLVKLPYLKGYEEGRRKNASRYRNLLAKAEGDITLPLELEGGYHVYNQFVITTPRRDELKARFGELKIGTEVYYPVPLHLQECFRFLGCKEGQFPNAERAAQSSMALPIFGELSSGELEEVVSTILDFFKS